MAIRPRWIQTDPCRGNPLWLPNFCRGACYACHLRRAAGGRFPLVPFPSLTCLITRRESPAMRQRAISDEQSFVPAERIEQLILFIRGEKVILDASLAELYGVETGALNRAVKRNGSRFPEDFMFQLTPEEVESLRCHFGISKHDHALRSQSGTVLPSHDPSRSIAPPL